MVENCFVLYCMYGFEKKICLNQIHFHASYLDLAGDVSLLQPVV